MSTARMSLRLGCWGSAARRPARRMIRYGSDSFCGTGLRPPAARIRPRLASPTTRPLSMRSPRPPVSGFAPPVGDASLKVFDKPKPAGPIWRVNWAITVTDRQLALPPNINATFEASKQEITANNAGHPCYFRLERQTLAARTRGVHCGRAMGCSAGYSGRVWGNLARKTLAW